MVTPVSSQTEILETKNYFLLDQCAKFGEQRRRIMRPRRRFGMILHAKNRLRFVAQTFDSLVVQIDPVNRNFFRQAFCVHRKAVVLRGDFHLAGFQILHRLIAAAMAEFQFESFSAKRLAENLVAEANAKNGNAGINKRFHFANDVIQAPPDRPDRSREKFRRACVSARRRRARSRAKPAWRIRAAAAAAECYISSRNRTRQSECPPAAMVCECFRASATFISANQIKCRALLVLFIPAKRLFVRDFLDVIHADEDKFLRAFDCFGFGNFFRGNKSVHRAAHAEFFCQRARVNSWIPGIPFFSRYFSSE